jgi:hypothetical protein
MQLSEKIYFIISGVREGFKKSHLLCNNDIAEVINYIDDRRQITNNAIDNFYTIEKTNNYTLVSVFNPNTIDHVGRKAYIAITLFVKNGLEIKGDIVGVLAHLMNYYEQKQTNEITNRFTEEMFEAEYANLGIGAASSQEAGARFKQGYILYDQVAEIASHFQSPTINGFQKVYFFSNRNLNVANQLVSFEKIVEFPRAVAFSIIDLFNGNYDVFINDQLYDVKGRVSQQNLLVYANQGDVLKIVDLSTKKSHTRVIAAPGNNINILDLFPKQTRSITTGPRAVGGSSTPRGPINNDSKDKKLNRVLMIMIGILVPCVIGLVIYTFIDPPTPPPPSPPKPAGPVVNQPEPIDTNQSANTNVTNTTVVSGNLTNTVGTQNPRTTTTTATNPRSGTRTSTAQGAVRGGASNSQPAATSSRSQASTSNSSSTSKASKTDCKECQLLTALMDGQPSPALKAPFQKKIKNHPTH